MGTPNRESQEYSRNVMEYQDPARYIPHIFLLYSADALFGVPSKVPSDAIKCHDLLWSPVVAGTPSLYYKPPIPCP